MAALQNFMRIKRLELVGFKSFVNPTVIDFNAPIVGVVGPNGCGKSNVVDAIRWVMGEMSARSLRGRSMEDVIFNGSDQRPPLGLAEVSLTFSTDDGIAPADYAGFSEVTVTRRLFRSGESEYLINKVPSRLRDVVDLFLGTGVGHRAYSIIEQGKIDFVIQSKPEDRRLLIEEAAGVSKFKSRKESALRRIEATQQNLLRLQDILKEVNRQINSLDRQVKKAETYNLLRQELRTLEVEVAAANHLRLSGQLESLQQQLSDLESSEAQGSADLSTLETDLEEGRLTLTDQDRSYNILQEKTFETTGRFQLSQAQLDFNRKELTSLENLRIQTLREIEEMKERLATLMAERTEPSSGDHAHPEETVESQLALLQERHVQAETEWKDSERKKTEILQKTELLKGELNILSSEASHLEGSKRICDEKLVSLRSRKASGEMECQEDERLLSERRSLFEKSSQALREAESLATHHETSIKTLQASVATLEERKETLSQEVDLRREALVLKRSRLKSLLDLERNFEGYEEGVRSILKRKKENRFAPGSESPQPFSGVLGVVAECVETTPPYEMALSAALGEKLQYVIVKSHEEGVEAIHYLKTQSSGRSAFIPMEVRSESDESAVAYEPNQGVVGPLLSHVRLKEGFQKIGKYLLNDILLVQSLSEALILWKSNGHKKTLVTLDGEVVDPSGVVSGGATGLGGKMLLEKKREIRELQAVTAEMEEEIGLKEDTLSQFEGSLSEMTLDLEKALRERHEEELKRMSLTGEVQHLEKDVRRTEEALSKARADLEALSVEMTQTEQALAASQSEQAQLSERRREKEQDLSALQEALGTIESESRKLMEKLTELRIDIAAFSERKALAEREEARLAQIESDLRHRIEQKMELLTESNQKLVLLTEQEKETLEKMSSLKQEAETLAVALEEARIAYEGKKGHLQEKESRIRELRREYDGVKNQLGHLRVTLSQAVSERSHLEQQMLEKYAVELASVAPSLLETLSSPDFNEGEKQVRIAEIKSKMEKMSDVNLGAIPEYEELKQRRDFLGGQLEDLENSLEALKKAIHRINQTTRQRFEETFHLVNERFQTLFPRLFHGGRAELRLVDVDNDPLHSGVELMVQPPGKKLSHVGLLSGGEKAMSAMAFVFAIFLVRPSPFCILDEVDAPLDDLNVSRFHNLLTEMTSRTQFILITHNRKTMEKADLLYGVTMPEAGCSQLVSVRLSEGVHGIS